MPAYRLLLAADVPAIVSFFNPSNGSTRPINSLINMGYSEFGTNERPIPLVEKNVLHDLDRAREKWAGAFDDSGNMRGFIQLIFSRTEKLCIWGLYAIDPNISLANVRTYRDEICKRLINLVPDGFIVQVPNVSPTATIAREYLLARFGSPVTEAQGLRYSQTVEVLRTRS